MKNHGQLNLLYTVGNFMLFKVIWICFLLILGVRVQETIVNTISFNVMVP